MPNQRDEDLARDVARPGKPGQEQDSAAERKRAEEQLLRYLESKFQELTKLLRDLKEDLYKSIDIAAERQGEVIGRRMEHALAQRIGDALLQRIEGGAQAAFQRIEREQKRVADETIRVMEVLRKAAPAEVMQGTQQMLKETLHAVQALFASIGTVNRTVAELQEKQAHVLGITDQIRGWLAHLGDLKLELNELEENIKEIANATYTLVSAVKEIDEKL
ncbi:MAG: hypothetical protein RML36_15285 [Anaerolineae bacterium]|nr:hypothetical protein [Anaerolineae bacterium]